MNKQIYYLPSPWWRSDQYYDNTILLEEELNQLGYHIETYEDYFYKEKAYKESLKMLEKAFKNKRLDKISKK